jgi:4-amino-4-deoxy-L-arabinose transferase-like glycosyltransferase
MARVRRTILRMAGSPGVVFLVALTIRVWVLSQVLPQKAWEYFYRYNEPSRIAWALVSGFGYSSPWPNTPLAPTAQQPPVYPLLIAGIFKLAGAYSYASLLIAVGLNAVLSSVTAIMMLRLGKRDFGSLAGILAAWVWACWMYEGTVAVRLWESSLSALLLLLALLMLPKLKEPRTLRWLCFGLLAAVAGLTNTSLLSAFTFFWIWLWVDYRQRWRSCRTPLTASVGIFVLALLPWTIRNYEVFHRLIPVRDNFGLELWIGNHEGEARLNGDDFQRMVIDYSRMGELSFMDTKGQIAAQFIRQHPASFLRLSAQRFYRFWTAPDGSVWILVSLLACYGLFMALRQKGMASAPYAIVIAIYPLVYYLTHNGSWYRHPAEPVILLLAAYGSLSAVPVIVGRTSDLPTVNAPRCSESPS